jgi:succinate--hydroxymethylglutarate CoA-transferase
MLHIPPEARLFDKI